MDLGAKIKEARIAAGITQEQAAEKLFVSRQTISNWENGKTYPDIVSVVKMSDLYNISLDCLLKEKNSMKENENADLKNDGVSDYVNYLEESSNVVKNKQKNYRKLYALILFSAYIVIWGIILLLFWCSPLRTDALGFSIFFFWLILPVSTFACAFLVGFNNFFGHFKWLFLLFFGVMTLLAHYLTFSLANMILNSRINVPDFESFLYGIIPAALGMALGWGIHLIVSRVRGRKKKTDKT